MCPLSLGAIIWQLFENSVFEFMMKDIILKIVSGSKIVGKKNRPEGNIARVDKGKRKTIKNNK